MLQNNNLNICRKLVRRELSFYKARNSLLMVAIALTCALCTFSFGLGGVVEDGYLYNFQMVYGSTSHILYTGLTSAQADRLVGRPEVKSAVRLSPIGLLSDDAMEYRSVHLAAADPAWAKTTEALPLQGRMPQTDDEIALDELTLSSLGIPKQLGAAVTLRWQPADGSPEQTGTFKLCGWWASAMNYSETYAWITPAAAQRLCPSLPDQATLGITLHQPGELESQATQLMADAQLTGLSYTTNLSHNQARTGLAASRAMPYFLVNLLVVLCGMLMIYNITRISTAQNLRFYGRLKSLGMSPRQIRSLVWRQATALCLPSIPLGWLLGLGLNLLTAPIVVVGMAGRNPALVFFNWWPFGLAALLAWLTTLTACWLPARAMAKTSPAQVLASAGAAFPLPKTGRRTSARHTRIPRMALASLAQSKGRILLSGLSLFLSLTMLCNVWTQYGSYDEEKYLAGMVTSDYHLANSSATNVYQRYNPNNQSITPELVETLRAHPAVTGVGVVRTMEVPLVASEAERAPIVNTFEALEPDGTPRKEYMATNTPWMAGYEKLRATGEYIGIITGLDGLALDVAVGKNEPNAGRFDAAQFASGQYAVAVGGDTLGLITTPPVGSKVTIAGHRFEIMVSQPAVTSLTTGADSKEAAFNVSYCLPMETFQALFPEAGIRNVLINIDHSRQQEFEAFLQQQLEGTGVVAALRSDHQWTFKNGRLSPQLVDLLVGCVLLFIGLLGFGNSLATKMLVRKKELAVYQSLGMTMHQLKQLLLCEGLLQAVLLLCVLAPAVAATTWFWTQNWLANVNTWCITYRFSLLPLWFALPVLLALALALPLLCLRFITKESVTQRLRLLE